MTQKTAAKRISRKIPALKPGLKSLERLVGSWKLSGPEIKGEVTFEWLEGGFFLVQRGRIEIWGRKIIFIEYIGYDANQGLCTSHLFDNYGNRFTYAWEIVGDKLTIWFGQKGSDNCFQGKFNRKGDRYSGAWKWPGGGYTATATKVMPILGAT